MPSSNPCADSPALSDQSPGARVSGEACGTLGPAESETRASVFRSRVGDAIQETDNIENPTVQRILGRVSKQHAAALRLLTGAEAADIRAGFAAYLKVQELDESIERMFTIAEKLDRIVRAGEEAASHDD